MAFLPLRPVDLPPATERLYDEWLRGIEEDLERPDCDRYALCRRVLGEMYFPGLVGSDTDSLPLGARVALAQLDPAHVTLEPEYYHEIDVEKWERVKPLIWLWEKFDDGPLGRNVHLGVRFRRVLARKIFKSCGRNFKAFHDVKLSYGYNLEVGDDVVVHRHVLLDDRGGIRIGDRVSISDYANVYSHTHDIVEPREVHTPTTVIGDGVRITYHATILAGVHVAPDSMVGAVALATRDTRPHWVHVGLPAHPVKEKPAEERERRRPPTPDPLAGSPEGGSTEEA